MEPSEPRTELEEHGPADLEEPEQLDPVKLVELGELEAADHEEPEQLEPPGFEEPDPRLEPADLGELEELDRLEPAEPGTELEEP